MFWPLSSTCSFRLGFSFSVLCAMISGLDFSFNVYALQLKETFNLTQTQDELVASMSAIGVGCGYLETICTWLFGFKTTCFIVAFGAPASSALFFLTAHYNQLFHSWPGLICLIQLTVSIVFNIGFFACTRVCVEMLSKKHTGKLVAIYLAACCMGKIYYGALMEFFFHENLSEFLLSVSVGSAVTYCPCLFFLYPAVRSREQQLQIEPQAKQSSSLDQEKATTSVKDMLKSPFFQVVFLTSAIFSGLGFTCLNNITTIAQSAGMPDPLHTVFLMSCVIFITRISFGAFIDAFRSHWNGLFLLQLSYVTFCVSMVICLFYLRSSVMFLIVSLSAIGIGAGVPTPVAILLDRYGRVHYSLITSGMYTVSSVCQIALQVMIGYFYDLKLMKLGLTGAICYGQDCFYWPVLSILIITSVIAIIQVFNFVIFTRKCT